MTQEVVTVWSRVRADFCGWGWDQILGAVTGVLGAFLMSEGQPGAGFCVWGISNISLIAWSWRIRAIPAIVMNAAYGLTTLNGLIYHFA